MSLGEIIAICASIAAIVGVAVSIAVMVRNNKRTTVGDAKEAGELLSDIKYIRSAIEEVKATQSALTKQIFEIAGNMGVLKNSIDSAHKRIDRVEKVLDISERRNDNGRE